MPNDLATPGVREIPLTKGKVALVDADDHDWLTSPMGKYNSRGAWYYHAVKGHKEEGYAAKRIGSKIILMHRLIMGVPNKMHIHHINGIRLDNRRENLQILHPTIHRRLPKKPYKICPLDKTDTLGRRIKAARAIKGWTQTKLAREIYSNLKRICFFERGVSEPTASELIRLAQALGVTANYLLYGSPDNTPSSEPESKPVVVATEAK